MGNSEYKYNIPVTEEELNIIEEALNLYSTRLTRIAYEETEEKLLKQKMYDKSKISDDILVRLLKIQLKRESVDYEK